MRWVWELRWGAFGLVALMGWFWALFSKPDGWDPVLWAAIVSFAPFIPLFVMLGLGEILRRRWRSRLLEEEFTEQSPPAPSGHARHPDVAAPR